MPRPGQESTPRPPGKPPDRAALHEAALRHLARFAATEIGLLRVLDRRIGRWQRASEAPDEAAAPCRQAAREVVRALVAAGALDDAVFAAARARRLVRAGRSRRAVQAHLAAKGVDAETAGAALPDPEAEFLAAIAFLRRRRFGPFRPTDDGADRVRELATLARAGFPRDVAERALRLEPGDAAELLAQLKRA
ncbi:MAG: RecX family transcriptional regulator [Acetobacteraceae bacterium]|nr:RecX family transcriptional regulator [Acetobacteraceae bacterium]